MNVSNLMWLCVVTALTQAVQATPSGSQVTSGGGSVAQSGNTTTVTQTSDNLSLNWQAFDIAPQETVNFVQPSTSAIAVNRILDTNATQILGSLNANGQVYLINPNGILFGQGAQVNVGGIVASALNFDDQSLSDNARIFSGTGTGSIINQGTLNAATGGYVALLGNQVNNQGTMTAPGGSVLLGAGKAITLTFPDIGLVQMQIDQSVLNSVAENGGLLQANGGQVIMHAGAKNALLASVVNNTGVIEAHTVEYQEGSIILLGGMEAGTTYAGGTLDASAPNGGNGGFIDTSAAHVKIVDGIKVSTLATEGNTGTWLIDPADFNIGDAADGAVSNISGATLSSNLASSNVEILSSNGTADGAGNINVNETVSWSANTLTLTAAKDININAVMNAEEASKLVLNTAATNGDDTEITGGRVNVGMNAEGFIGRVDFTNPSLNALVINNASYTIIEDIDDLQDIEGNLAGHYALGSHINAASTASWNSIGGEPEAFAGFAPITSFTGTFNGLGHEISDLTINNSGTLNTGLFKEITNASLSNIGLRGGAVTGESSTGSLVGSMNNNSTVTNAFATGNVTGEYQVGGLVGHMGSNSNVTNVYGTGNVTGKKYLGGLVGLMTNSSKVDNAYATGNVTGKKDKVGGLVGHMATNSNVTNVYATGNVTGEKHLGGLVGRLSNSSSVTNVYATGNVTGEKYLGGLVGLMTGSSKVTNAFATGSVVEATPDPNEAVQHAKKWVGGLVGRNRSSITNAFTTTEVGDGAGTIENPGKEKDLTTFDLWVDDSGAKIVSAAGTNTTWRIYEGQTAPLLRSFMTQISYTKTYDGLVGLHEGGSFTKSGSNEVVSDLTATGFAYGSKNAGSAVAGTLGDISMVTGVDLQTVLQKYDVNATGVITRKALTVSGLTASDKTYDGETDAGTISTTGISLKGLVKNDDVAVSATGTFNTKNVGEDKIITLISTNTGADVGNYTITDQTRARANITAIMSEQTAQTSARANITAIMSEQTTQLPGILIASLLGNSENENEIEIEIENENDE